MQQVIGSQEYKKIGEALYDKTVENSARWNIIQEKENEKNVYGTGWNYIEKGSNIANYGNAKYNWLVNYDTEEIIKLEDESYNHLNGSSSIAVKDGLVFSYDSAYANADKESFGEHSKLYSFDIDKYPDIESRQNAPEGYDRVEVEDVSEFIDENTHALKFNGNNYIEIESETSFDFSNGFTCVYYGTVEGLISALDDRRSRRAFRYLEWKRYILRAKGGI